MIIVSHDREYSEQYADRIIELADGQIISDVSRTAVNTEIFSKKPMLTDGVCRVLGGYELTPQDFEDINRYIAEHPTEPLRIRVDDNLTRGFAFEPTAQQPDDTGKNLFEKIRSKLPMLRAARIGITGLKSKKIRLVFTVIMSVVAFSLFGLASTLADYDYVKTVSKVFVEENVSNVYVKAETQRTYVIARTYDNNDTITRSVWTEKSANEQDFNLLRSQAGISVEPVYNIADLTVSYTSEDKDDDALLSMLQLGSLDKWIEIDEKVLADYGCMLKVGKLPDGEKNEVAISLVAYDMIRNSALLNGTKIPKMTDMVGKQYTVSDGTVLTVTGIIDTGLNYMSYVTRMTELLGNNGKGNGRALISWNQIWGLVLAQDFVYDLESNLASCNMVGKGYVQRQPLSKLTVDDRNVRVAVGDDSERYGLNIMFGDTSDLDCFPYLEINAYNQVTDTGIPCYISRELATQYLSELLSSNNRKFLGIDDEVKEFYLKRLAEDSDFDEDDPDAMEDPDNSRVFYDEFYGYFTIDEDGRRVPVDNDDSTPSDKSSAKMYGTGYGTEFAEDLTLTVRERKENNSYLSGLSDEALAELLASVIRYCPFTMEENDRYDYLDSKGFVQFQLNIRGMLRSRINGEKVSYGYVILGDTGLLKEYLGKPDCRYAGAMVQLPTDRNELKDFIRYSHEGNDNLRFQLQTKYNVEIDAADKVMTTIRKILIGIGIFFAVFAALLMTSFIASSIVYKKREVGILRAIGSRGADVYRIFGSESCFIAAICFALATLVTGIVAGAANYFIIRTLHVSLMEFGIRQVLLIAAVSFATALIASFLPVYLFARKRPIDAIRGR